MALLSWTLLVDFSRLFSLCCFLICSLTFTWYSFTSLIMLLGAMYLLDRDKYNRQKEPAELIKNPYKGIRRLKNEDQLPSEVKQKYINKILDFALYDAENCQTLANFEQIKRNTHCSFAMASKLWGAKDYDQRLSLEGNVERSIPALIKLLLVGDSLHLDGFVFEVPEDLSTDINIFGDSVRRVLKHISDNNPTGYHCMDSSFISGRGWSFEFCSVLIFVTTFAPCYPDNHSRYSFGTTNGYILLQPMYSFAIHDIGSDTPHTNWDNPTTVRDKIRVAFKTNGRPYYIRDTIRYPMSHDIVKPLVEGPGNVLEWWKDKNNQEGVSGNAEELLEREGNDEEDQQLLEKEGNDEEDQQALLRKRNTELMDEVPSQES